ncbi:oxidoreductase [Ammoniphilus oxalaticus]|uniref:Oxidoreductase n=1 Tax=Ammoniphilus oxalaticus TaxID=66863 RepID=A0A419SLP7_9BACL|nr:aldo/keto reductase [Ammoniphilus oxalaticus]RKD24981.1 oxidoreductase [Ammoniphilus oxalaticus]
MRKNRLGSSDLFVSEIGMGCMSLGVEVEHGIRMIHQALASGINFLDTADLYDYGRNEEIVGKAIKGRRDEVILATKVGNRWNEQQDGWRWDPSKAYIKEAVKQSLRRLSTDYIDLYQLHGGTIDDPFEETIEAFEELKQEGLIRAYGISSLRPNVIRSFVAQANIVSVMLPYSILDRRPEEELLALLERHEISVIARGPLAKGYLSERVLQEADGTGFLDYTYEEIRQLITRMKGLSNNERSLSQLALRYPLGHGAVATVIPGASQPTQLASNAAAAQLCLSDDERVKLQTWSKRNRYQHHRG